MDSDRLARNLFYAVTLLTFGGGLFVWGAYSGRHETPPFSALHSVYESVKTSLEAMQETPVLLPTGLLQPARYEGRGVTINEVPETGELVMLAGFFGKESEIRLMRRDGKLVRRWPLIYSEVFEDPSYLPEPPATSWNVDTHGSLAMPDGSVVFNFDYSGLARIDRCGKVMWTVAKQTHHSVERAEAGGFWVPGQRIVTSESPIADDYPPFEPPFVESTLMHVSDHGKVVQETSVVKLFYESGLEANLTAAAAYYEPRPPDAWNREIVHLNKITELSSELAPDFPMFEAGDLLLSFRNHNLLMVVSPRTWKVKWWQVGPWKRQHDPEFRRGGSILVFNNNIYLAQAFKTARDRTTKLTPLWVPRISNIVELNVATGQTSVVYGTRPGQEMLSVTRGKVEPMASGGLLITEFDGGRAFETDPQGQVVWQYVNRYDDDEVSETTEARVYPAGYFTVKDWSCKN